MQVICLSQNIANYRKKRKITQEELAGVMGVTKASVSKWETGITMPDVQLLPMLASYFGVTLDELMGYKPQLSREQISATYHRLAEDFATKDFEEVMEECQALIKEYYSCYPFLEQMCILLINHCPLAAKPERAGEIRERILQICSHVMEHCQDIHICENMTNIKALVYLQQGQTDQIIEDLEGTLDVNQFDDRGTMLTLAYMAQGKLEMADKSAQIGMYQNLSGLLSHGLHFMMVHSHEYEKVMETVHRLDSVIEAFAFENMNANTVAVYQYQVAVLMADRLQKNAPVQTEEEREALEEQIYYRLEAYCSAITKLFQGGIRLRGDDFLDRLDDWFEGLAIGNCCVRSEKLILESALEGFAHPAFAVLRNQDRMQELVEKVKKIKY